MASTQFTSARRIYSGGASITQATGITITGWLKFSAYSPWGAVLNFGDIILGAASSEPHHVELDFLSGGQVDSGYDSSSTAWFFFAITWSGATVTIKISSDFATITNTASTTKAATWTISSFEVCDYQNSNERYNGQIHHLRVFADVLSDSEILAEMASTTAVLTSFAAWELNDASLSDLSGNARHLTGTGGTVVAGAESAPVPEESDINAAVAAVASESISTIAASSTVAAGINSTAGDSTASLAGGPSVAASIAGTISDSVAGLAGGPVVAVSVAALAGDTLAAIEGSSAVSGALAATATKAQSVIAGTVVDPVAPIEAAVSAIATKATSQTSAGVVVGASIAALVSESIAALVGDVQTLVIVASVDAVASQATSSNLALCEVGATIVALASVAQSKIISSPVIPDTPLRASWASAPSPSVAGWIEGNDPKIINWR